jgi:hypothetical protein
MGIHLLGKRVAREAFAWYAPVESARFLRIKVEQIVASTKNLASRANFTGQSKNGSRSEIQPI